MSAGETTIKRALEPKYEIKELIATGGMGDVYLGVHGALDRRVAIKIIHHELKKDEQFRKRFHREAKLSASLDHPVIVDVYDFGSKDDFDYLIMQYVEGSTLQEKLEKEGKLGLREGLRLMMVLADALSYAHQKNVIHRDIKPSNIMVDNDGHVVLTDFGISKGLGDADVTDVTAPNTVLGSPKYMSPEQIKGVDVDSRSDLYSLGVVSYEMITGKHPFGGKDTTALFYCHVHEVPERPEACAPEIPGQLCNIIMKLLDKVPEGRYQNADQLLQDLKRCDTELFAASRMDVDATLADASSVAGGMETLMANRPSETRIQDATHGSISERPAAKKEPFWKARRGYKYAALGLLAGIVVVFILVTLIRRPSKESAVSEEKAEGTSIALKQEKGQELPHGATVTEAGSGSMADSGEESEEALTSGKSFDEIVKSVLALGQEREAGYVHLWTDKRRFNVGDLVSYHFRSDKDCYVVLLNVTAGGELIQIFPNKFTVTQFVQAGKDYTIPGGQADFALRITGPLGKEEIVALAAKAPFDLLPATYEGQSFFQVSKDDQAILERIRENIQSLREVDVAQKRISYSIVEKGG